MSVKAYSPDKVSHVRPGFSGRDATAQKPALNKGGVRSLHGQNNLHRKWSQLAMIWSVYYLLAYTLGQIPVYMQPTIWFGAAAVGLITFPVFWKHVRLRQLPREVRSLAFFTVWILLGLSVVVNVPLFVSNLKIVVEVVLMVMFISVIIKYSGESRWFYLAFLGVGVWRVFNGDTQIGLDQLEYTRGPVERVESANELGFYCSLGFLSMFALWRETKNFLLRGALIGCGVILLYGIVLSASRGAFSTVLLSVILWSVLCLPSSSRLNVNALVGAFLILFVTYVGYQYVMLLTPMGVRFSNALEMKDTSSQYRFELFLMGLQIFWKNPLLGCGLGQFGIVSGTGFYTHNEVAELLATTGLPGFILYYSVYVVSWKRLSWSLKYMHDPLSRYRVNTARMILVVLLITGALSNPNFLTHGAMFLLSVVVGISLWAEQEVKQARLYSRAITAPLKLPSSKPGRSGCC